MHKHQSIFGEFSYKAGSWDKERRVIVKIEKPKGQLTFKYTFIVTNIKEWNSEKIFKFYCQRGTMENFIKEAKHGFAIDKMSSTDFWTNANKLQQMLLAYNLNNWMRWLCFPEINLSNRISTIRTKIIKIAGKIVKTGRYIYFKLANYLENLTEEQLEEINEKHSGNLLKKVLQIEIPDYDKDQVVRKVVKEWDNLQKEISNLENEIVKTDNEIDRMVYDLYGLTNDEIEIVEGSVK